MNKQEMVNYFIKKYAISWESAMHYVDVADCDFSLARLYIDKELYTLDKLESELVCLDSDGIHSMEQEIKIYDIKKSIKWSHLKFL